MKEPFYFKVSISHFYCPQRKKIYKKQYFLCCFSVSHKSCNSSHYNINRRLCIHLHHGILFLCADTVGALSSLPLMQFNSALDAAVFYCGAGHVAVNEQDCMNNVLFIQWLDKNECPQHLRTSNLHHFLCAYSSWSFNYLSLERIWQLQVVTTQEINPTSTSTHFYIKYSQMSMESNLNFEVILLPISRKTYIYTYIHMFIYIYKSMTKYYIFLNLTVFGEMKIDPTCCLVLAGIHWRLKIVIYSK